jgi:ABC-type bacteriocin/lantibiotic exporter with double-glycine peptidase domain
MSIPCELLASRNTVGTSKPFRPQNLQVELEIHCCSQEDAELHYGHPEEFTLKVPKFEVNPGEVVAIVGKVGSGKICGA